MILKTEKVSDDDIEEANSVTISTDFLHPETTRQRILKMVASLHGECQKSITTRTIPSTTILYKQIQDDGIEEDIIGTKEPREHEEESLKKRINRSRQKTQDIMTVMDKDNLKRYDTFRRSGLHRNLVKRWLPNYLGVTSIHQNIVIMCSGVAKVFAELNTFHLSNPEAHFVHDSSNCFLKASSLRNDKKCFCFSSESIMSCSYSTLFVNIG